MQKGISKTTFKKRYTDHKKSFSHRKKTRTIQIYQLNTER